MSTKVKETINFKFKGNRKGKVEDDDQNTTKHFQP